MSNRKYRTKAGDSPKQGNPIEHAAAKRAERELRIKRAYVEAGGDRIDGSIKRLERLLAVHDAEVEKLLKGDVEKHRWRVSPSMVLRIQREIDELLVRQMELMAAIRIQLSPVAETHEERIMQVFGIAADKPSPQQAEKGEAATAATSA